MSRKSCAQKGCSRPPFEGGKCIDHAEILSAPSLARQLAQSREEVAVLRRRLAVAEAAVRAIDDDRLRRDWDVLERAAGAVLAASEASGALVSVGASDGSSGSQLRRTDQPSPGGSTRLARKARRRLLDAITEACVEFESAMENDWRRPRVDDVPMLRCGTRGCPSRDVNVKAYRTIRGGRRIYAEHCVSCGGRLTDGGQE